MPIKKRRVKPKPKLPPPTELPEIKYEPDGTIITDLADLVMKLPNTATGMKLASMVTDIAYIDQGRRALQILAKAEKRQSWNFMENSMNQLCLCYLICSVCYYEHNLSIIGDDTFDRLCKYIDNNWDKFSATIGKGTLEVMNIDRSAIQSGTGFQANMDYYSERIFNHLIDHLKASEQKPIIKKKRIKHGRVQKKT